MIADAHNHLDVFDADELAALMAEAGSIGVELMVTVGMDCASSAEGIAIAESESSVYAAVGLHPWNAQDYPQGAPLDELRALASHERVVAIGEIGLDFYKNKFIDLSYEDPDLQAMQEKVFRQQLQLARELKLPVIIHSCRAHASVTRILGEEGIDAVGGCVQFFEGTPDDVARYAALGFTFTIGSSVTFPDPGGWYDAIRAVPADALLLESDAPYLPYRGREPSRSAPHDVRELAEAVAQIRGDTPAEIFSASVENLRRVLPRIGADGRAASR